MPDPQQQSDADWSSIRLEGAPPPAAAVPPPGPLSFQGIFNERTGKWEDVPQAQPTSARQKPAAPSGDADWSTLRPEAGAEQEAAAPGQMTGEQLGRIVPRTVEGGWEREKQYLGAQAHGWMMGDFGLGEPEPTFNQQTGQYEWPQPGGPTLKSVGSVLTALGHGDFVGAAREAVMQNLDEFPDYVRNLVEGKKIPESFGAAAVDAFNIYQGTRGIPGVPGTSAERPLTPPLPAERPTLGTLKVSAAEVARAVAKAKSFREFAFDKLADWLEEAPTEAEAAAPSQGAQAIRTHYGENIPESDAAIEADLYKRIKTVDPTLTDRQVRGIGQDIEQQRATREAQARAAAPVGQREAAQAAPPTEEPTPAEGPVSDLGREAEQGKQTEAEQAEARRQAYESMRATRPAAAAPTPTAPAGTAASEAEAPTEGPAQKFPSKPLEREDYPTRDEVAQAHGFEDEDDVYKDENLGKVGGKHWFDRYYSGLDRIRQAAAGTVTLTDDERLLKLGYDQPTIDKMSVAESRRIILSGERAPGEPAPPPAPAEEPAAAPAAEAVHPVDALHAQIEQADIPAESKPHLHGMVDFYAKGEGGVPEAQRQLQQVLGEAEPETAKPTWKEESQQKLNDALAKYDAKLKEMGTKRYAGFSTEAMPELINVGKALLERGFAGFDEWSREMLTQLGNHVRPYLDQAWQAVNAKSTEAPRGAIFVSPNVSENMTFEDAKAALNTDQQAALRDRAKDVMNTVSHGGQTSDAIGDWSDGAENTLFAQPYTDDQGQVRYMAALLGKEANQKAVIPFTPGEGNDSLWHFVTDHDAATVRDDLSKLGVQHRTLIPEGPNRTRVYVFDPGTELRDTMVKVGDHYGQQIEQGRGTGEFLGGDTREEGSAAYQGVINDYEQTHEPYRGRDGQVEGPVVHHNGPTETPQPQEKLAAPQLANPDVAEVYLQHLTEPAAAAKGVPPENRVVVAPEHYLTPAPGLSMQQSLDLTASAVKQRDALMRTGNFTYDNFAKGVRQDLGAGVSDYHISREYSRVTEQAEWGEQWSVLKPSEKTKVENWAFDPLKENRFASLDELDNALDARHGLADKFRVLPADELRQMSEKRMANQFRGMPGLKLSKRILNNDRAVLQAGRDFMLDNLQFQYEDIADQDRIDDAQWYPSSRMLNLEDARNSGVSHRQSTVSTAVLSPENEWNNNLGQKRAIYDVLDGPVKDGERLPKDMYDWIKQYAEPKKKGGSVNEALQATAERIKGKRFDELTIPNDQAWWVRAYDTIANDRGGPNDPGFTNWNSYGQSQGPMMTRGGQVMKLRFKYMAPVERAISAYFDGSPENLNELLGDRVKVRSFGNNMHAPNYDGGELGIKGTSVCPDTHVVAGAHFVPYSSKSEWSGLAFSASPGYGGTGIGGSAPMYVDAFRQLAQDNGWLPNHQQSINWVYTRKIFPTSYRTEANVGKIEGWWREVSSGKTRANTVRNRILEDAREHIERVGGTGGEDEE